ncbi:MAG: hypothetical protein KJ795_06750 [Gammaproteobacteria bacterium]|nr:hypothetical protein [Gammaproteobacteria bacterium]MBU1777790.1 hypothetical protein [Gammaproteobacteria bacterium]MBU1969681.1 hypothetical protein [Gammaproteobacteria bacterium]
MSPHDSIERYFSAVEAAVSRLPAYAENYSEEILTSERANLRIRLRFDNGALLEINEALVVVNGALTTLGYRYHLQQANNELVFRYDNTPHFPDLPSFPNHKHLSDSVVAASKPELLDVLQEAQATSL